MTDNDKRAQVAKDVLEHMSDTMGDNGDLGDNLTDLLTNLMHLAEREGLDFNNHLHRARNHYEAES